MPNTEPITPETLRGMAAAMYTTDPPPTISTIDKMIAAAFIAAADEIEALRAALGNGSLEFAKHIISDHYPDQQTRCAVAWRAAWIAAARAEIAKEKETT